MKTDRIYTKFIAEFWEDSHIKINLLKVITTTSYIFATGFGCGYIPKIPGTIGSLFAVLLYWFFPVDSNLLLSISIVLFVIGVPAATVVEKFEEKDSAHNS